MVVPEAMPGEILVMSHKVFKMWEEHCLLAFLTLPQSDVLTRTVKWLCHEHFVDLLLVLTLRRQGGFRNGI
jgi:hypothetical protein